MQTHKSQAPRKILSLSLSSPHSRRTTNLKRLTGHYREINHFRGLLHERRRCNTKSRPQSSQFLRLASKTATDNETEKTAKQFVSRARARALTSLAVARNRGESAKRSAVIFKRFAQHDSALFSVSRSRAGSRASVYIAEVVARVREAGRGEGTSRIEKLPTVWRFAIQLYPYGRNTRARIRMRYYCLYYYSRTGRIGYKLSVLNRTRLMPRAWRHGVAPLRRTPGQRMSCARLRSIIYFTYSLARMRERRSSIVSQLDL